MPQYLQLLPGTNNRIKERHGASGCQLQGSKGVVAECAHAFSCVYCYRNL